MENNVILHLNGIAFMFCFVLEICWPQVARRRPFLTDTTSWISILFLEDSGINVAIRLVKFYLKDFAQNRTLPNEV